MKQFSRYLNFLIIFVGFISSTANARINNFQTTRLKSTAGTGAASVLVDEATVLNPAPLAFFNVSSFYFQKTDGDLSYDPRENRDNRESDQMALIASDTSGGVKGSISYIKQSEGQNERKTLGASLASNVGKSSAWGLTYKRITNQREENDLVEETNNQFSTGVLHAISPEFTIGVVLVDPFGEIERDRKGIVGFQYLFKDIITVMADIGADYKNQMSESFLYRTALQVKFYNDFYIRAGYFNDKGLSQSGTGAGLSWVQPKLMFDIALSSTDYAANEILGQKSDFSEKETSFSISYRF